MLGWTDILLKEIQDELLVGTKVILDSYNLGESDMFKDSEWVFERYSEESSAFVYLAYDYFQWIVTGRKPLARKVPIEVLIRWMKKKGIAPRDKQTYNSVAFAIQNGIYKNGIKAKDFADPIVEFSLDRISEFIVEQFSIMTADEIVKELNKIELKIKI